MGSTRILIENGQDHQKTRECGVWKKKGANGTGFDCLDVKNGVNVEFLYNVDANCDTVHDEDRICN